MGRHVDTTRPPLGEYPPHYTPIPGKHRADREHWGPTLDVWSGDPDTDRAWAHAPDGGAGETARMHRYYTGW